MKINQHYLIISLLFCYATYNSLFAHTATCGHNHEEVNDQELDNSPESEDSLELILPGDKREEKDNDDNQSGTKKDECAQENDDEEVLIDTIKVIVGTENKATIITLSQEELPSLDGSPRTEQDLINETLMYQSAIQAQPKIDEEAIDKMLKQVMKDNNITLDQLKNIFKSAGYTFEEGREQFGIMSAINSLLDFKVRSRLSITEAEIKSYYDQHPVMQEATYYIERVFIPLHPKMSLDELHKQLTSLSPQDQANLHWSNPFTITKDSLAEEKKSIIDLEVGAISEPYEWENGYELFKMTSKQDRSPVPLQDRYREISETLRKARYETLMAELQEKLLSEASIIKL